MDGAYCNVGMLIEGLYGRRAGMQRCSRVLIRGRLRQIASSPTIRKQLHLCRGHNHVICTLGDLAGIRIASRSLELARR